MKFIIMSIVSLFSLSSFAAQYGMAGCGLGSLVMGKEGNQILAATTNGTSGSQTFGITSGTSNCVEGGSVKKSAQATMYIEVNKLVLAKEASRGQGATVTGLANLYNCDSAKFGQALKANYKQIFVETNMQPQEIEKQISSQRANACGA